MKTHEEGNERKVFAFMVYHVTDAQGMHRFLTMNSFSIDAYGGSDVFEGMLAKQFKTFELLGTTPMLNSEENPYEFTSLDPQGAQDLGNRIKKAMAAYPNSSRYLEPWLPGREEPTPAPINIKEVQWRPMATLKKELGTVNLQRIIVAFQDTDIRDLVKPEFVSLACARGGAKLNELKEDVRSIVEPELMRSIEDPTERTGSVSAAQDSPSKEPRSPGE